MSIDTINIVNRLADSFYSRNRTSVVRVVNLPIDRNFKEELYTGDVKLVHLFNYTDSTPIFRIRLMDDESIHQIWGPVLLECVVGRPMVKENQTSNV